LTCFSIEKRPGLKPAQAPMPQRPTLCPVDFNLSVDRKKRPFLGLFCRKTGIRAKENETFFRAFPIFWGFLRRKSLFMSHKRRSGPSKKNRAENPTVGFLVQHRCAKIAS